jgi:RNA polymerase sigma-70 factor (ECF subfamily)
MIGLVATSWGAMSELPACCCADWVAGLARAYADKLAAVARREGVGAEDALDVVQDAFHTFLRRPESERLRDKPDEAARLLGTIVRNAARNARRRHHRARPHVEVSEVDLPSPAASAADTLDRAETTAQLVGCMARLGDIHRHVITLRVLEELSGEQAASALGVTPSHVAVLLHRARKQLEACLEAPRPT